ncbi:ribonuclease H-like domain-containing protein [Aspergillus granulosus]|uniref:Ribonuclease H-like domain-containing protein n=1 Tax=Aspergillus granulosus TaxID=176169 RepID=A0ABR4GWE1_9EURO
MDSAADFPPFQQRLTSSLVQVTRTVGQLPVSDLNFHRSSNPEVSEALDEQSGRLLSLTSSILKAATAGTDISAPTLSDEDAIDDNWRGIVDVIDALLEKADACLDEFTGVIKKLSPSQQAKDGDNKQTSKKSQNFPTIYDYGPSKIPKPQLQFERQVDNTDTSPFKPLLKSKPHAIEPLERSLISPGDSQRGYRNPYETEIRAAKYPDSTYVVSPPIDYLPFESTTATFVDTLDGVKDMLAELRSASEIAIDLEHHDVHSYYGLVSLMQISTREKDWVVDTLKPWREELQVLNEVFANPKILKLFHGSSMDIIWLQRDLGLYVVGMFDTYHAACALNYPRRSLKFLLQKFVEFEADKKYQMADWRIRPLPSGMFDYARSDTHYLLYIYDNIRNELVENSTPEENLIEYVQEKSKTEALQRYERPVYDAATGQGAGGWYDLMVRNPAVFSREQFAVFRAVHEWRDQVAREEDEGVQCVFPKHVLFRVAQVIPLDLGTLFRTLSPMTPITKERAPDLLEIIKNAKAEGATGPEWRDIYVKPIKGTPQEQDPLTPPLTTQDASFPIASRCEISQFWGGVLDSQTLPLSPPEYSIVASAEAARLSLPLPPMPRTVSEVREKVVAQQPPKPASMPTLEKEEEEEKNKIFTVKELGGPRKRKAAQQPAEAENEPSPSSDEFDLDQIPIEVDSPPTKKQRRKEKKEKKKEKQAQNQRPEDTTPFDYEQADSILNANPQPTSGLPSKRPFNPYAKALQAPSGVRKEKREIAGKSHTFR